MRLNAAGPTFLSPREAVVAGKEAISSRGGQARNTRVDWLLRYVRGRAGRSQAARRALSPGRRYGLT